MNTNSNTYTIVYASVIVVIVAFLLAFVATALKPTQDINVAVDKKQQILASLNERGMAKSDVETKYAELVKLDPIYNEKAEVAQAGDKEGEKGQKDQEAFKVANKDITASNRPLYICEKGGETIYVVPVKGAGLWGGISGYVALKADCETVYGTYFTHESETAGLGARITEEWFQTSFNNKKIFGEDKTKVILSVLKKGKTVDGVGPDNFVDAVTGATLTSNGVNDMIQKCLQDYIDIFEQIKK